MSAARAAAGKGWPEVQLSKILEPILSEMAEVEVELAAMSARIAGSDGSSPAPLGILGQIAKHPFAVPGKRLRPALVLLSFRGARVGSPLAGGAGAGGSATRAAIGLASAVEVLHSASLVHDDIIDGASERRHQVSLNKRFGNRVAVLAGDILYTEFFELLTRLPVEQGMRSRLLSIFLGTTKKMCIGEIIAQEAESADRRLGFEEYAELCYDKTASLFASCCEGGALVGGADEARAEAFRNFGSLFGLTFQMLDDLKDGDHCLERSVDLREKAEDYGRRTRATALELGLDAAAECMTELVGEGAPSSI
jgi:geranylgeranyl pyrophosphate synthase